MADDDRTRATAPQQVSPLLVTLLALLSVWPWLQAASLLLSPLLAHPGAGAV